MHETEGASATPDIFEAPDQRREARTVHPFDPLEIHDKVAAALAQQAVQQLSQPYAEHVIKLSRDFYDGHPLLLTKREIRVCPSSNS
jgi:hypothetical protein